MPTMSKPTAATAQPGATLPTAVALSLSNGDVDATISVRGTIGDWWDGIDVRTVDRQLDWLPANVKNITLRITSYGGDLAHGLAIHAALARHPAHKVVVIEGVAASAATIIAMAADEIRITANSAMMVHGVSFQDEDGESVEYPAAERVLNETIVETYAAKTGKARDEISAALTTDTWMTAREAVAQGWADTLIELTAAQVTAATASTFTALASAATDPASIAAAAAAIARATAEAAEPAESTTSEGGDPQPAPVIAADDQDAAEAAATTTSAATTASATAPSFAAQVAAIAATHGLADHLSAWLLDTRITTLDQATAAIAEAREIRDLCTYIGQPQAAAGFIRARQSLSAARAALIDAAADQADASQIDTAAPVSATAGTAQSGNSVWAKVLATTTATPTTTPAHRS